MNSLNYEGSISKVKNDFGDLFKGYEEEIKGESSSSVSSEESPWEHKPVSPVEFIESSEFYGDKERGLVWNCIKEDMENIFSGKDYAPKYKLAVIIAGIGSGKSLEVSMATVYCVYRLLCLRNPFRYFRLVESTLAFMNMATHGGQAKHIVFNKISKFIGSIPWFQKYRYLPNPNIKSELQFPSPKDIWICPGNSSENFPLGADLYGGVIDEAAHFMTLDKDPAEEIYSNLDGRRESRFKNDGIVFMISDATSEEAFIERKFWQSKMNNGDDGTIYAVRRAKYVCDPHYFTMPTFEFSVKRKYKDEHEQIRTSDINLQIPECYKDMARKDSKRLLRQVCGIPSLTVEPYFLHYDLIDRYCNRGRQDPAPEREGAESPIELYSRLPNWFQGSPGVNYYAHFDLAKDKEGKGDKCGFAIAHRGPDVDRNGQVLSTGVLDLAVRFKAGPGKEIIFSECRDFIYKLHQEKNFKFGKITLDRFQSSDFIQIMSSSGYLCEEASSDKGSYDTLKSLVYDNRLDYYYNPILFYELENLEEEKEKVHHAPGSSCDIADAVARVCFLLLEGDSVQPEFKPRVRRGVIAPSVMGGRGGYMARSRGLPFMR